MLKNIASVLLTASFFFQPTFAQDEALPEARTVLRQLQSEQIEARRAGLEQLGQIAYALEDQALREQFRSLLFSWLANESDAETRYYIAANLQALLSDPGTPTASFLKAEPYLVDPEEQVRHLFWLAFYQPGSNGAWTDEIDERLLAHFDHPDKRIQLEATNWAIEAARSRTEQPGEPPSAFSRRVLEKFYGLTEHSDPDIRNNAVYDILSQFDLEPARATAVIEHRIGDTHGPTRSLILDFLEQNADDKAELASLQPVVLARFRARPFGGDFPLQADADLGPAAGPPMSEEFRLAGVLTEFGPLPDDVWTYLEEMPSEPTSDILRIMIARSQGPSGLRLLRKLMEGKSFQEWAQWSSHIAFIGLPPEAIPDAVALLKRPIPKDAEFAVGRRATTLLQALITARAATPEVLEVVQQLIAGSDPDLKAIAVYAASVLDPTGPAGQAALKTLNEEDLTSAVDDDFVVLATDRFKASGSLPRTTPKVGSPDSLTLMEWLYGREHTRDRAPYFVELYQRGVVRGFSGGTAGTGSDETYIELRWLAEHPQPGTEPGLRRLAEDQEPRIRQAAVEAQAALSAASATPVED